MFTEGNSDFAAEELPIVNEAVSRLIVDRMDEDINEEDAAQIAKTIDDAVNNAWVSGITADEIVAKVRGGH